MDTWAEKFKEARRRVENLAWQRENNAVVSLDLTDAKAIRVVLDPHTARADEEGISRAEAKRRNYGLPW